VGALAIGGSSLGGASGPRAAQAAANMLSTAGAASIADFIAGRYTIAHPMTDDRPTTPDDFAPTLNENPGGWNRAMGVHFVRARPDEVVGQWTVGPEHRQPYGIVHGGVYAGIVETLCSVGAALDAMAYGLSVVGIENHTSFLRAARGRLTCG
jgi:acyl-coenzyme A thioesterase PaaI-like protein